jgi:DNA-binding NarL/FixJ family response regulator
MIVKSEYNFCGRASVVVVMRRQLDADLLSACIAKCHTVRVVCSTSRLEDARQACNDLTPALLVLDAGYPTNASMKFAEKTAREKTAQQIALLDDEYMVFRATLSENLGVAYLSRKIDIARLMHSLEYLATNHVVRPSVSNALIEHEKHPANGQSLVTDLSKRQLQVMTLLCEGFTVRRCAKELGISPYTADNHKAQLMKKLNVHKTADLVRIAIQGGLIKD